MPSVTGLSGEIDTLSVAATTALPTLNVAGIVNSLAVSATTPSLTGISGSIESVALSPDIDPPTITGLHGRIDTIGVSATPPTIDLTGLTGTIGSVALSPDIDPPTIEGLAGRIDSITLDPAVDLRIPVTAVVGPVAGGSGGGSSDRRGTGRDITDEDPENPKLGGEGIAGIIGSLSIDPAALADIQPVQIAGVINASLNKLFDEPIVLQGRIDATVNYLTGANVDQGDEENRQGHGQGAGTTGWAEQR